MSLSSTSLYRIGIQRTRDALNAMDDAQSQFGPGTQIDDMADAAYGRALASHYGECGLTRGQIAAAARAALGFADTFRLVRDRGEVLPIQALALTQLMHTHRVVGQAMAEFAGDAPCADLAGTIAASKELIDLTPMAAILTRAALADLRAACGSADSVVDHQLAVAFTHELSEEADELVEALDF